MFRRGVFWGAVAIAIARPAAADPIREYLDIGLGATGELGHPTSRGGVAVELQLGRRVLRHLYVFDELDDVIGNRTVPPVDLVQELDTEVLAWTGVRWTPRSRSSTAMLQPEAVYLEAGVGYVLLNRSDDPGRQGPLAELAVGYLPLQGESWALGAEARGESGQAWDVTVLFELGN